MFTKILDKSITAKARDKMKQEEAKTKEDEKGADVKHDFLAPILKKLNLEGQKNLEVDAAM